MTFKDFKIHREPNHYRGEKSMYFLPTNSVIYEEFLHVDAKSVLTPSPSGMF